jgi:hypothetical protein
MIIKTIESLYILERRIEMKQEDPIQLLRNPDIDPNDSVLKECLLDVYPVYVHFLEELIKNEISLIWRYYPDGRAWLAKGIYQWIGKRGAQKEKTLFWCSVWNGFFKLVIYVPDEKREELLNLTINPELKESISEIKRMGETFRTLPIVFDVRSMELFESMLMIIDFKKRLK